MARNPRYMRPGPLLLLLHHFIVILLISISTLSFGYQVDTIAGVQEEPTISTTTTSSLDQSNFNDEPPTFTIPTTSISTSTGSSRDPHENSQSTVSVSTTPGLPDVQMELINPANTTETEPTTLQSTSVQYDNVTPEPFIQASQLVRNRKSSEGVINSNQYSSKPSNETSIRRTETDRQPEQAASTVSTLDYDDFDLDYQIKLNTSDSIGGKRDYDSGASMKPPTWSALIRQPHVFTSTNINQSLPSSTEIHQAPHIPPALLTVKSTQLSSQELDKIKNQLLMFQDQYESFGADQSLAFANGDLLATASQGTLSPASILALNSSRLDSVSNNITNLRKLAMDLQSSGMPSIAPLMLENLLMQAKLLTNRSNLFSADEVSSATSGSDSLHHSSSEATPLSMGSGSFTTPPTTTSSKGSSHVNQWHNYPHPNIHQNPLLLHHILNKPAFYAQQVNLQQSDSSRSNPSSDIAIASTASTPIQIEKPTSPPQMQDHTASPDFSSHTPAGSSSNLFLDNLQQLQAQQKRAILSSTLNNLQQLHRNTPQPLLSLSQALINQRPTTWNNQPSKLSIPSSQIFASPSLLQEFYAPRPESLGLSSNELLTKHDILPLLRQRHLQQQALQNKSDTKLGITSISDEDMSTYVAQLSQQLPPNPNPIQDQVPSDQQISNTEQQIAALLKHLRSSNSGLNLTELEIAVQKLVDAHLVSSTNQDNNKSTTSAAESNFDDKNPPSKQQASNWHRKPTVHVSPPMNNANLLKVLATSTASASNQSTINVPPLDQVSDQQQNKDYLLEQLQARKKQLAFIEALKMRLQQQVPYSSGADSSINSPNSLDEILALGSGESNGTTNGSSSAAGSLPLNNDFDDQVSNKQIPKWLERQILQGGFVHQSARNLPTIGKTIRTTYIGRPTPVIRPHSISPLFFRPAASQLQLIRQPALIPAPLHPQPVVRLGPQQALQLLLGNTQFSLQRLPPQSQDQQLSAKIVSQDAQSTLSNTQSNQSQTKLLAESFPLASAPAYLIKLPTLTGGTITASGSFAPPSMRFLRGRPLVPLRILSAPSRIRLVPAATTSSSQVVSNHNTNTGSSLQPASSMVHSQHQFPPMHPAMNPMLQAHILQQQQQQQKLQHQQQQQQQQQQLLHQQQLLRPLLAMASLQQQVPHLAYSPTTFATGVSPQISPPASLPPNPIVEPNSLLNIPPHLTVPTSNPEFTSSQAPRFQQLFPSASHMSVMDTQNISNPPSRHPTENGASQLLITDSGNVGNNQNMGAALTRLQQATASLVELTSLASLVDEMSGSEIDPSPAVALVQALSSLQHNNPSANQQSQQYSSMDVSPQITPPLTLKNLLNVHLWRDRQLSKARDLNNLERLVAAANAANAAKGANTRLKVKYIRVPVAVYESTGEPVLAGTRSILGQEQLADLTSASQSKDAPPSNHQPSTSTTTGTSEQQSPGSVASPSSTDYIFDELSSDTSPHLALALQELAQRQPVDQSELLALTSSYRNTLSDNRGQMIDPLELYVSLANAPKTKSIRTSTGRKKRARKGRKKEIELETVNETSDMDVEATEIDEDDRVTRKDLPILESLINTIFHGPQPMYGPMYSSMPMDSYGSPWYRHRPLRAEASSIAESYVPHPLRHHHHHSLNPFARHRFTLGEVVGALGAKKIITSLLSKSRKSRTSKRTTSHAAGITLAGGQAALAGYGQPVQNSSSSLSKIPSSVSSPNLPATSARPNPVFVWFPMGSSGMDLSSSKKTKTKLLTTDKPPLRNTASVIHGSQRLTLNSYNSTKGLTGKSGSLYSSALPSSTTTTTTTTNPPSSSQISTSNIATTQSSPSVKLKSNNHKPLTSSSTAYNFKSFFLSSPKVNASSTNAHGANNSSSSSFDAQRRREEVTAIPLYHVVADHYSKLYSEPTTQLAKHPSFATTESQNHSKARV